MEETGRSPVVTKTVVFASRHCYVSAIIISVAHPTIDPFFISHNPHHAILRHLLLVFLILFQLGFLYVGLGSLFTGRLRLAPAATRADDEQLRRAA